MINIKSISALTSLAISSIAISSLIADDELLLDKSLESLLNTNIQTKSQVGTRDTSKDYLQSSSPVDVITLGQIQISGVTKLTDLLNYYISGFTVTRTSLADGIDHIVQYTLRGMKAD